MIVKNKNQKNGSRKKIYIALAVVLLIAIAGIILLVHNNNETSKQPPQSASTKLENKLGKEQSDKKGSSSASTSPSGTKQSTGDTQAGTSNPVTTGPNVTPVITYFGKTDGRIEVDAFVPAIVENGGTCTLTITSNGGVVSNQTKPAYINAQATNCENFFVDSSGSSTAWKAVVSYSSPTHNGSSQAVSLQN